MSDRPERCPFCANTDLAPADPVRWSCIGSLGCGGVWDPAVLVAAPPRADRRPEAGAEEPRRRPKVRAGHRVLRRRPVRPRPLSDAA